MMGPTAWCLGAEWLGLLQDSRASLGESGPGAGQEPRSRPTALGEPQPGPHLLFLPRQSSRLTPTPRPTGLREEGSPSPAVARGARVGVGGWD